MSLPLGVTLIGLPRSSGRIQYRLRPARSPRPSWKYVISPEPETPYADFVIDVLVADERASGGRPDMASGEHIHLKKGEHIHDEESERTDHRELGRPPHRSP